MKIIKSKNKKVLISTIVVILLVVTVASYLVFFKYDLFHKANPVASPPSSINYDNPTQQQIDAGNDAKGDSNTSTQDGTKDGQGSATNTQTNSDGKYTANVFITSSPQSANGDLNVRATVDTIETGGQCILTVTNSTGSVVVTQSASLQAQSSYSSCIGFTVPKASLPNGTYTLNVSYTSDKYTGTTSQQKAIE